MGKSIEIVTNGAVVIEPHLLFYINTYIFCAVNKLDDVLNIDL